MIVVLVPTYRRPTLLLRALDSLLRQSDAHFTIIVTDNDREKSGIRAANEWAIRHKLIDRMVLTGTDLVGLSANRNEGLRTAFADPTVLAVAMLDDDSEADCDWVAKVRQGVALNAASLIGGPTIYRLPENASAFARRQDAFQVPHLVDGQVKALRSANNCIITRSVYILLGPNIFSSAFDRTGGEDTHLFLRANVNGIKSSWCASAIVYEGVPPARCTREWIMRRHKTSAANSARAYVEVYGRRSGSARQIARIVLELVSAVMHLLVLRDAEVAEIRAIGAKGRFLGLVGAKPRHEMSAPGSIAISAE